VEPDGKRPDGRPQKSEISGVRTRREASRQRRRPLPTFNICRIQRLSEHFWRQHEQLKP